MNTLKSRVGILAIAVGFAQTALAAPSPIYVATNGVDGPNCGAASAPCRTITRALEIAPSGGAVAVRPGIYGDVNADTTLVGPEEEAGTESAVITITKPVRLYSTNGAATTTIEGGFSRSTVLEIFGSSVTIGGARAGFTITGANGNAGVIAIGDKVTLTGNAVLGNAGRGVVLFPGVVFQVTENVASDNQGEGFFVAGSVAGYAVLKNNLAIRNAGEGFSIGGGANAHQVTFNVASNNHVGIAVGPGPSRIHGNKVTANNVGIALQDGASAVAGAVVTRNEVIGNKAAGIGFFRFDATSFVGTIRENNIYGTTSSADYFVGCGVLNNTSLTVDARNNFWGVATGPGAKPADTACGPATVAPFAAQPFSIPSN